MSHPHLHAHRCQRRQRGSSLFEALVAVLVLSLGLIGLARLQGQQRSHADDARLRTEAVRLAQSEMEDLRSVRPFSAIASAARSVGDRTVYRVDRAITPLEAASSINATISVSWVDRGGEGQRFELHSMLSDSLPALGGALLNAAPR